MARLKPVDLALLLVLVPAWLVVFALHTVNAVTGRLAEPSVYVGSPAGPEGFPVVRSLRVGGAAGSSGLQPGDELLRIGDNDLRGVGPLRFFALAMQSIETAPRARVEFRRGIETYETWLEYTRLPLPIRFFIVSISFAATALLLLARAPRNPSAALCFRALLVFSFGFLRAWGGPVVQTYCWYVLILCLSPFFAPLLILASRSFREVSGESFLAKVWPWLFLPVGPMFAAGLIGIPLSEGSSNLADPAAMVMLCLLGLSIIAELTISFRSSNAIGRRKIKWIVYGIYVVIVPVLIATGISLSNPELWWLSDASEILEALIPVAVFIAVVRFGVFDIDRIISATASYTILIIVGVSLALTAAPALADSASQAMGIDAWTGRLGLSIGLVSVAIPAHRLMSHRIDRAFFPARHTFNDQVLKLMDELPRLETPSDVLMRASARIDELLRPESCSSYLQTSEGYANIFARGRGVPPVFDGRNPLIAALEAREMPLVADRWSKTRKRAELSAFDRAALESLDAAVIVPIRRSTGLLGFACLGPKRSGDLYTATDLTLLGSLGNRIAAELVRFDADELVRQAEEMQAALRSYVPGAVAAEIEKGKEIRPTECEVSVLFVDIRGYTALSQQRPAEEVFSMVSRYTEAVSDVIRRYAGSVVEFHGDGLMAVFGAPNELAAKERAAVEAGCTILDVMASIHLKEGSPSSSPISVGIGVATGRAFVGNIRAVDRWIWSAIGNTTNRAARLESLTRDLGAAMVVDEATQARAAEECEHFEKREGITIRGYSEPTDLYVLPLGQQ